MSFRNVIRKKRPPPGWDQVETVLEEFEMKMRDAMNEPIDDKMRNELTWQVHKLHHQKNRYFYDAFNQNMISKAMLDYLIQMKVLDGPLIAKWKKPGYERLCSLIAISKASTNFRTTSICRVPLSERHGQILPSSMTGCVSCATVDDGPIWWDDPVPDRLKERIQNQRKEIDMSEHQQLEQLKRGQQDEKKEHGDDHGSAADYDDLPHDNITNDHQQKTKKEKENQHSNEEDEVDDDDEDKNDDENEDQDDDENDTKIKHHQNKKQRLEE